jgi:hypothetical protein
MPFKIVEEKILKFTIPTNISFKLSSMYLEREMKSNYVIADILLIFTQFVCLPDISLRNSVKS